MATETTEMIQDTLRDLIEVNRDAEKGFASAAEKLGSATTATTFRQYAAERAGVADELVAIGGTYELAEEDGSMTAGLHRAWIAVKDTLTSGDHAIFTAAETGEDHAVTTYKEALATDLPQDIKEVVRRQFAHVKEGHDRVRNLRDSTA